MRLLKRAGESIRQKTMVQDHDPKMLEAMGPVQAWLRVEVHLQ